MVIIHQKVTCIFNLKPASFVLNIVRYELAVRVAKNANEIFLIKRETEEAIWHIFYIKYQLESRMKNTIEVFMERRN